MKRRIGGVVLAMGMATLGLTGCGSAMERDPEYQRCLKIGSNYDGYNLENMKHTCGYMWERAHDPNG